MSRWFTVSLLSATLSGCIIYEQRYVPIECNGEDCETTEPGRPDDPTVPTAPEVTNGVVLTVNEASPGDTFLSFLVPNQADVDVSTVETVTFERDVAILDIERRPEELVLLLSVAGTALPGDVEVYITTTGGGGWVLAEPFHILGAATTTPPTTTTSGGDDTGTDTTPDDTGTATP